uniref:Cysteine synthase n=1 Tax=Flavobacterium sp. (strain K3-15 / DSM ID92-509) TaxID=268949 RepID=CYSK_FLAS3|nr:RecName: Full=Cysteine synthase; Short=CSase; AltName: Full=O-acetylserine (thiol)-lyase; Short=OAS-TL; AltName: Full=O-acetylserine sulfhydrylase [Flavobacterium sp. K3-15/DSM ID92-509]CAA90597.1 cysteine synthase [Flavobacterium sp.]prf//2209295A Cys synthase [Flavobacterium sp.]
MKFQNALETIGNTPVVKINNLFNSDHEIWIKLEKSNPGGSIKDRIALAMIEDAEAKGLLNKDSTIIEPTSGNTGIGLALVAAVKGYKLILVMPESMSIERRKIMEAYGAEFVLTPREKGMKGAIEKANELAEETPNSWIPRQFDNPANVKIHVETTAQEILQDFPEGLDYVITGVGTGGHITGIAKALKEKYPNLKVIAVEPELSPVLSGGSPAPHPLQGLGAGFVPSILDITLLDGVITVGKDEAYEYAINAAKKEGLFCGSFHRSRLSRYRKTFTGNTAWSKNSLPLITTPEKGIFLLRDSSKIL